MRPMTAGRRRRLSGLALAAAVIALPAASPACAQPAPEAASGWTARPAVHAQRGIVATANAHATDAAHAVLARGGSAVDVAIAAQLVLGLVEPQSSGIGGGAFLLVLDARSRRLRAYDGRETAPASARPDRFLDAEGRPLAFRDAVAGGRSVGVPGLLRMLELAHRAHGRRPWAELFEPAITLAEAGFAVSPRLATLVASDPLIAASPAARAYFHDGDGRPIEAGARLRNPAYAATLRAIAAGGADAFHHGPIARGIVATVRSAPRAPGDLTEEDLAGYRAIVREPVCGSYRGLRVCGMPAPSSGGTTVLAILGLVEPYDLASMGPASFWSVHFLAEAGRLAYADRDAYVGDPAFVDVPAGLTDPAYLRERGGAIRATASIGRAAPGTPPGFDARRVAALDDALELPSTSHLSIVDAAGNAVAMTTTIEDAFGSRLMTPGGFLLNNQLTDFSFRPVVDGRPVANRVEPGKRPRSSMAPTIVYDASGRVRYVAGSPGGAAIIHYVAKTLVAMIDWKLDPQAAVALPNFGSRNGPTELERDTPVAELAPKLAAIGHPTSVVPLTSGLNVLARTSSGWSGGTDPRREGSVRGD